MSLTLDAVHVSGGAQDCSVCNVIKNPFQNLAKGTSAEDDLPGSATMVPFTWMNHSGGSNSLN